MGRSLLVLALCVGSALATDFDRIVAGVQAKAARVRAARLAAYAATNFDVAFNSKTGNSARAEGRAVHTPIPPETSPESQTWTGKGNGRIPTEYNGNGQGFS